MPYIKPNTHPREVFKILADVEGNMDCHLYSDKAELNKLDFTPTPEIPLIPKVETVSDKPGWMNFVIVVLKEFKSSLKELKP